MCVGMQHERRIYENRSCPGGDAPNMACGGFVYTFGELQGIKTDIGALDDVFRPIYIVGGQVEG
jgi:hypothetical protein